ncbi:sensor histidine kinase [Thalassolituus sp. LLYu03]|uniref:sensor histidine kinase n=1 Tax=Thalassolituus sp. LLYu03 TaxID=3421656 RepID=UPI003D2DA5F3
MANAALSPQTELPGAGHMHMDQAELRKAFTLFSEMSQQLTDSYSFLEHKVEQLSGELASVSAQRMQELAEKERLADRLKSLLQLLPAGVLLIDQNGYVAQSNPAADDLLLPNAGVRSLIGERWRNLIRICFKPRQDDGHEISLVDGRRVHLRTAPMANEPGQLILLTDMTETRALQSKLSQHERLSAMGKMVASLAHQIRTPLAAATLYAGHLENPELDNSTRVKFAGKLNERLRHLENQVRDMLIFARGEAPLNDEITLQQLMQGVSAAMEVPLASYGATCSIHNEIPQRKIICNRDALISSLMNLVNNALESVEPPVHIDIQVSEAEDGRVHVRVMDNGPGLTDAQKEKIMQPFFTTKANGTGLGLAVVQAVARAHRAEFLLTDSPAGGVSAELILQ